MNTNSFNNWFIDQGKKSGRNLVLKHLRENGRMPRKSKKILVRMAESYGMMVAASHLWRLSFTNKEYPKGGVVLKEIERDAEGNIILPHTEAEVLVDTMKADSNYLEGKVTIVSSKDIYNAAHSDGHRRSR